MKLKSNCSICGKELKLKSELATAGGYLRSYTCGHSFFESLESETATESPETPEKEGEFTSITGKKFCFDFQKEGIRFIEKTNYNCLIADPMGLGKTIQALVAVRNARLVDGTPRFKSILVVVKSATTYQWFAEAKEWFDSSLWSVFRIEGSKSWIPPGFRTYIISMDTLSRFMSAKNGGLSKLKELCIDMVIVDECHSFKNPESARSQALVAFLQDISNTEIERDITLTCNLCQPHHIWTEKTKIQLNLRKTESKTSYRHQTVCPQCNSGVVVYQDLELAPSERKKGLILLSGTPIKNRADEYFIPLNLLRPDVFTSHDRFRKRWLAQDPNTGKYNRIHPYMLEEFRKVTSNFIIRREKNTVLKDLPAFRRTFETIYIEDETLKIQYNRALKELADMAANAHNLSYFDVQANLMTLRRITGMAKIPFAVEYVDTFLDTVEDEKIAIGIHHEGVRDGIFHALYSRGIRVLKLSGEDSPEQKNRIVTQFQTDPNIRVMVVNMIAGGVGLNLQSCNNALILERQWNAADEEQFEARFHRQGQKLPVLAEYMLAQGTIDTYFSALVEQKRQICGESLDGWEFTSDPNALRELIEKTVASRL